MGVVIGTQALGHVENGILGAFHGFELIPHDEQRFDMILGNGSDLAVIGEHFQYRDDGTATGTITGFSETNADGVVFELSEFDLSAAALFGFIADQRPLDLANYLFAGDDLFVGTGEPDVMAGFPGNDTLVAGAGADSLDGADGDDSLEGGDGADVILGERGADMILGGDGNDTLLGGMGIDTFSGGAGNDVIFGGKDYDVLDGGAGDDVLRGDLGGDDFYDSAGNDTMFAGVGGDDWFHFFSGSGQDRVEQFNAADGDLLFIERHINNTPIVDFASLVDRIASDGRGDTIIDLGGANYIRLVGIDPRTIDAGWFEFVDREAAGPPLLGGAAA